MSDDKATTPTIPPELARYVKPEPVQHLLRPGTEAQFRAAMEGMALLDAMPDLVPADKRTAPASESVVYVAPVALPRSAAAEAPAGARVQLAPALQPADAAERARAVAQREAPTEQVHTRALRLPRDPDQRHDRTWLWGVLVLVGAAAVVAVLLFPGSPSNTNRSGGLEGSSSSPASTSPPSVVRPSGAASTEAPAPPASIEVRLPAEVGSAARPPSGLGSRSPLKGSPKRQGDPEDPYDAAPLLAPSTPRAAPPTLLVIPPRIPAPKPTVPPDRPIYD